MFSDDSLIGVTSYGMVEDAGSSETFWELIYWEGAYAAMLSLTGAISYGRVETIYSTGFYSGVGVETWALNSWPVVNLKRPKRPSVMGAPGTLNNFEVLLFDSSLGTVTV